MQLDLAGVSVQIGMPILGHMHPRTVFALIDTMCVLKDRGIAVDLKGQFGCSIVEQARTFVCHTFLQSQCSHLFMIDADMVWSPEDFLSVLALATRLPIVAAPYPYKREPESWLFNPSQPCVVNEYGCLPIAGVGLGFCCVRREVIETLARHAPRLRFVGQPEPIPHLFRCGVSQGRFLGEDMAFFKDCLYWDYQPWLYPRTRLGHVGSKEYTGDFLAAIEALKRGDPACGETAGENDEQIRQQVQPDAARSGRAAHTASA